MDLNRAKDFIASPNRWPIRGRLPLKSIGSDYILGFIMEEKPDRVYLGLVFSVITPETEFIDYSDTDALLEEWVID